MRNLYPLFERNRILKKELLWSLRDYSFAHIRLEYQEYGQGIVLGCATTVEGRELTVNPGIIKCRDFVCLLTEAAKISYAPADCVQLLKLRIEMDQTSPDFIAYNMELLLDDREELEENEFELCRFHLRGGAELRDRYTNFFDMATEYDTLNLICASYSGLGGEALSPVVTRYFSNLLLESGNSQAEDRAFAYVCLSHPGAAPKAVLQSYIRHRGGALPENTDCLGRQEIYARMCTVVRELGQLGKSAVKKERERRRIIVD